MSSREVWVFVELRNGRPADVSFELLSKGHKLAQAIGGRLLSVVIGRNTSSIGKETFRYGADEALLVDDPALEFYRTMPFARVMTDLVRARQPRIVLFGATIIGRDLAPRVASATRSGLTADCTDLQISDVSYLRRNYPQLLLQIRPAFGGNIIATIITPDNPVQMATVREGVMEKHRLEDRGNGVLTKIPYTAHDIDGLVEIVEQHREESKVNLKAASIIVAGGYGLKTKENFGLIRDFAHVLGAEVAGSRAAVDAGFIPPERQVGQTGTTVRPKLYIAVGISGAIQHRAGMQESNKIVAINTDPDAPIFGISHYGIVGDAMEVIPRFIEVYKNKLK
ncbi:MAG: electron transfer flavoprotein subunit alpha [Ignavibacteria bacterium GWA2_55_11]|nr:MAG: electron transfer flavoprotein subunit alpha [Ignavibacteria bacterium GWA2_55_11]OGU43650.1 MAG: electron transfer flavoprotein subunit alpha [Ignavibacteria bacterium GWC2_56_12]OGU63862.1 MAG: electron transfer flavoprotein subunit alpha [Ignavibacteria bacterium RIFCSPHIGHO2_02_FULL_56_12]OGU69038.1 MAG: electron transfer flavoprotein subunit alpha [Ignavibacteria bacterium RIFCSPLOWO2_02_FULL_55_14]OGU76418.1 MAG: electron transfer flavoprotein subunit alpha [Ignavibacteria bacteri